MHTLTSEAVFLHLIEPELGVTEIVICVDSPQDIIVVIIEELVGGHSELGSSSFAFQAKGTNQAPCVRISRINFAIEDCREIIEADVNLTTRLAQDADIDIKGAEFRGADLIHIVDKVNTRGVGRARDVEVAAIALQDWNLQCVHQ
jgi:hypothetical protein